MIRGENEPGTDIEEKRPHWREGHMGRPRNILSLLGEEQASREKVTEHKNWRGIQRPNDTSQDKGFVFYFSIREGSLLSL